MFNLSVLKDTYTWKIKVKIPDDSGYKTMPIQVKYNRLPHDERIKLMEQIQTAEEDGNVQDIESSFYDKVFAGWVEGEVKDEKGNVVDDDEGKERMLSVTEFRQALLKGYFESTGGDAVKQKN